MDCAECSHRNEAYERLKLAYAAAIDALAGQNATLAGYQRLRRAADETRLQAELARIELEKHRLGHPEIQIGTTP